jgi:hypothetical protein
LIHRAHAELLAQRRQCFQLLARLAKRTAMSRSTGVKVIQAEVADATVGKARSNLRLLKDVLRAQVGCSEMYLHAAFAHRGHEARRIAGHCAWIAPVGRPYHQVDRIKATLAH